MRRTIERNEILFTKGEILISIPSGCFRLKHYRILFIETGNSSSSHRLVFRGWQTRALTSLWHNSCSLLGRSEVLHHRH